MSDATDASSVLLWAVASLAGVLGVLIVLVFTLYLSFENRLSDQDNWIARDCAQLAVMDVAYCRVIHELELRQLGAIHMKCPLFTEYRAAFSCPTLPFLGKGLLP